MNHGKYIQEDANGNAIFTNRAVENDDLPSLEQMVNDCPEKAMSIMEAGNAKKSGKEGVKDLIEVLKKKRDAFSIKKVSAKDLIFKGEDYEIAVIPFSSKEYSRYSSESQAKSAAREEFRRLCYVESAYRPILKKIFVEYKVRMLKPYYTCEDIESSAYFLYNKEMRQLLEDIYAEVKYICSEEEISLSDTWKNFSVYFNKKDFEMYMLEAFDERSTSSGIIADFKSSGQYTSLDWYVDRMDFDYDEVYAGEGLFGRTKYKNEWYFSGFASSVKEYIADLKSSINSVSDDISDAAAESVNIALGEFEKKVKEKLGEKIIELERATL